MRPETPEPSSSDASRDSNHRIKPTTSATDTASTATQYKSLSNMAVRERSYRLGRLPAPLRETLEGSPALPAQLLALASFVALAAAEGGYFATSWYLTALLWLALLATTAYALGIPRGRPRTLLVALALLAGYVVWAYVSIAWAGQRDVAWDGANRAAAYLVLFTLFAGWPLAERGARALVAVFGLATACLAVVTLMRAGAAEDQLGFLQDGRLLAPIGYSSGTSSLFTMALFACLFVATRRDGNPALRGVALGSAGLLATLAYMTQSRGWLIALPVAALAYYVLVPGRLRGLVAMAAVALSVLAIKGTTGAVYDGAAGDRLGQLLDEAVRASLLAAAALAVAGLVLAVIDSRIEPPRALASRIPGWAPLAAVVALLGATLLVFAAVPGPRDRLETVWSDFKANAEPPRPGESRFASGGTNRYDFWTVAWDLFREHPVRGVGVENFQEEYFLRGSSGEEPRFPHSLPLGVLSQTGLVGALLLGGALALALITAAGAWRGPPGRTAAAAGALAVFAPWAAQASIDWFWELAAITAPALAMLGAAAAVGAGPPRRATELRRAGSRRRCSWPRSRWCSRSSSAQPGSPLATSTRHRTAGARTPRLPSGCSIAPRRSTRSRLAPTWSKAPSPSSWTAPTLRARPSRRLWNGTPMTHTPCSSSGCSLRRRARRSAQNRCSCATAGCAPAIRSPARWPLAHGAGQNSTPSRSTNVCSGGYCYGKANRWKERYANKRCVNFLPITPGGVRRIVLHKGQRYFRPQG